MNALDVLLLPLQKSVVAEDEAMSAEDAEAAEKVSNIWKPSTCLSRHAILDMCV